MFTVIQQVLNQSQVAKAIVQIPPRHRHVYASAEKGHKLSIRAVEAICLTLVHKEIHRRKQTKPSYMCAVCETGCTDRKRLEAHYAECIYSTLVGTSPDKFTKWKLCHVCGMRYSKHQEEQHHSSCKEIVRVGPIKSMYRSTKPTLCKVIQWC